MAAEMMKLVAVVLAALLVVAVPRGAEAVNCGQVASALGPCTSSITGGAVPTSACCSGVKSLYGRTKAFRADRIAVCGCMKSQLSALGSKVNSGSMGSLAAKCGVELGFIPSVNMNCNSIP